MTRHNYNGVDVDNLYVVNCFQKLLSSWHDTTFRYAVPQLQQLWIAFKNYYLRDTTQPYILLHKKIISCELLSKIIIFVTRHNMLGYTTQTVAVVNCFQKLLSSWHDTTSALTQHLLWLLWIAFKNYYLRDTTQPYEWRVSGSGSCELLSKIIIFVTRHNQRK